MDYRSLNVNTIHQQISYIYISRIDNTLDRLGYAKTFRKINLASSYHQAEMHPDHHHKTAFQTKVSFFKYVVMPLGLSNAPIKFQRLITSALQEAFDCCCILYLGDILIYSSFILDHLHHINWVLFKVRSNYLFAKPTKYESNLT